MKVFIVVPSFNEGRRLSAVLDDLATTGHQVVVVDDGSRDRTVDVGKRHGCYVLRHSFNRGQGAALQTGITFALREGADAIVTFDADGQHQISDLPALLEPVLSGRCDVALGNRFLSPGSNVPAMRRVILQLGRVFTYLTSGVRVGDCHNGYRAFSRKGASAICMKKMDPPGRSARASRLSFVASAWKLSSTTPRCPAPPIDRSRPVESRSPKRRLTACCWAYSVWDTSRSR